MNRKVVKIDSSKLKTGISAVSGVTLVKQCKDLQASIQQYRNDVDHAVRNSLGAMQLVLKQGNEQHYPLVIETVHRLLKELDDKYRES